VCGARIVLVDDDGVRANMTASWLAQMDWEVHVLDDIEPARLTEAGPWRPPLPPLPSVREITAQTLADWLGAAQAGDLATQVLAQVIDLAPLAQYRRGHVPGAWFVLRSRLSAAVAQLPPARRYVLTCPTGALARLAASELAGLVAPGAEIVVLARVTPAWHDAGYTLESGETRLASPAIDRYRRPYEGTDAPREAMQGYLDWEFGLVAQLARDGTHGFRML
jgi:rhodanese-related sulfurtransferase